MKRRVLSLITALTLCLNLCPLGVLAADGGTDDALCPHHPAHTDECGYAPPVSGQECTHHHGDSCYTVETGCVHTHTAQCCAPGGDEPELCTHTCTEDSGCIVRTLSCPHEHDEICGYAPAIPGVPCGFVCRICPVESLIGQLPSSVSPDSMERVGAQLSEIYDLYDGLTSGEQAQVDLSPCAALQEQMDGMDVQPLAIGPYDDDFVMNRDISAAEPHKVSVIYLFDANGYTYTATSSDAIQVTETGVLTLRGTVKSTHNVGVRVMSGGSLSITDGTTDITGGYALHIEAGGKASLAGGTYRGKSGRAIVAEDGDYAALLAPGYAYFDGNGNPKKPADVAAGLLTVSVDRCTSHQREGDYTPTPGAVTHSWVCPSCGTTETEACTFTFDQQGRGTCGLCGNVITVAVDQEGLKDLAYDGSVKPKDGSVTVILNDGTPLAQDDYTVSYSTRADVGDASITVTVTVEIGAGHGIFTKDYTFTKEQLPVLQWATNTKTVPYTGRAVEKTELPQVTINIETSDSAALQSKLQYSCRVQGSGSAYTEGLPKNAGTYDVVVSLPGGPDYQAASSEPIELIVQPINSVTVLPAAVKPTYNRSTQELVTPGALNSAAAADGAEIQFSTSQNGSYSTQIPTGVKAKDYDVWYKVVIPASAAGNYNAVGPTQISGVQILPKSITPVIEVSQTSYQYDGAKKEPKITVKDGNVVIEKDEDGKDQYTVTWTGDKNQTANDILRVVGKYTATVTNVSSGNNYIFSGTVQVEIVEAVQDALRITGEPAHVYYGDTITGLEAIGGTGQGEVKWSISAGGAHTSIDAKTGVFTVKDTGSITVKAERIVPNYGTVSDTWTFTVEPKQVTAEVTVAGKSYDGTTSVADANITAAVNLSDLVDPGDRFTISGLKGTYTDADVGIGKTVTLDKTGMTTTANTNKYTVSCPNAAAADITPRQVTVTVTLSDHDLKTENNVYYYIFDNTEKRPAVTVTGKDATGYSAQLKASDYVVSYTNNKNAGTATVTVRNAAGGNYTFSDATAQFEIRKATAWLTSSPQAKVLRYTGQPQELVTVGTAVGGHVEYALTNTPSDYSPNIPVRTKAGTYVVYYKAVGEGSYADSTTVGSVSVTIDPMEIVSPKITISGTYTYNGNPQEPGTARVTVKDDNTTIPDTEYTLAYLNNINAGTATVRVINANRGDYIVNGTADFTIKKADITGIAPPVGITDLPYNGTPQELVKAGTTHHGTMVYSLDQAGPYSTAIPTGKEIGTHDVWYMVQGDNNYNDSTPAKTAADATIIVNTVSNPQIQVTPEAVTFNGQKQEPTVTVWDDKGFLIDDSEYSVTYTDAGNTDLIQAGTYTVTIKNKPDSNYSIDNSNETFEILEAGQTPLTITGKREHVYYGDSFYLQTEGGDGAITWDVGGSAIANIGTDGLLTIKGVGPVTVTATSSAPGYTDKTATWKIQIEKKPVTAVVTAAAKTYDGNTNAAVTAVLQPSDLVGTDQLKITLSGHFEDPSAGADKKVNIDSTNPTIAGQNSDKYAITYPATVIASIRKADINVDDATQVTKPVLVNSSLEYTGSALNLLTAAGSSTVGTLEYSLDGRIYSSNLPTGTTVGNYVVWYRVKGDGNHNDTDGKQLGTVTIARQDVTAPIIEFSPSGASYDGSAHQPKVIVKDKNSLVIPEDEYTVDYGTGDWIKAGSYPVKVTGKANGNYNISPKTVTFIINPTGQPPLSIITGIPTDVCYGDSFSLGVAGGSGNGALHWSITGGNAADIDSNGVVKVIGTGPFTVEVYREAEGGYSQSNTVKVSFEAKPKTITPEVTAEDKPYDGKTDATLHAAWKSGDLVGTDSIALTVTGGEFVTPDVGMNKQVKVTPGTASGDIRNYIITWPDNTTASIYQVDAKVDRVPKANSLTYNGSAQALVTVGTTENNIGRIVYSLRQNGAYSESVPTAVDAGTYTVWYKVPGSVNYTGIPDPVAVEVKIEKATPTISTAPTASSITSGDALNQSTLSDGEATVNGTVVIGTFAWRDGNIKPAEGNSQQEVTFTPDDTENYNTATCKVAVTVNPSPGNSTGGGSGGTSSSSNNSSGGGTTADSTPEDSTQSTASVPADVQNGTARSTLGEAEGSQLVQKAVANQSSNVVITQEAAEDVTKAEVSIPASTMSQLHSETNADLTVSAPVADVTIPHEALDTLANAGGTVDVTAERIGDSVVLTVTAGGAAVESVPGGVTLSVPVEDAAPGTVAVLVHEDGTEETIRKSMMEDGKLNIPLDGSATIKIVDNSKDFADVSDESWAADAIAFASAHELFNGTSENTFSPDQSMSRGMLTTVLYNLEGRPKQEAASEFSDVSSDAWYADSVAWAAANGITNGYSNGSFGPNDNVTREQFAVMLWNYAGKPEAADAGLDFADADQISGYAQEALRWATEKGILDGYSSGRLDPKGMATRAQAALMLKNFMENT